MENLAARVNTEEVHVNTFKSPTESIQSLHDVQNDPSYCILNNGHVILLNNGQQQMESPSGELSQNARDFLDTNKMETIVESKVEDTNEMSFYGNLQSNKLNSYNIFQVHPVPLLNTSDEEFDLACEEEIADIDANLQTGQRKFEILYNKNYLEEISKIGHQRNQSQNIIGFEKRFNESKGPKSRNYFQSSLAGKGDLHTVAEEPT